MDFLTNRTFRQTLLMHTEQRVDRLLTVERVQALWISSSAARTVNPKSRRRDRRKFCTPVGMCVNAKSHHQIGAARARRTLAGSCHISGPDGVPHSA
jgi:hypothetical protein